MTPCTKSGATNRKPARYALLLILMASLLLTAISHHSQASKQLGTHRGMFCTSCLSMTSHSQADRQPDASSVVSSTNQCAHRCMSRAKALQSQLATPGEQTLAYVRADGQSGIIVE